MTVVAGGIQFPSGREDVVLALLVGGIERALTRLHELARQLHPVALVEQAVWPEINMASVNFSHGMNVTIVFSNSNPKMSRFALAELGMPFEKPEDRKSSKK